MNKALAALKAVFEDMDSTGRAGDEWAYEWLHGVWPTLVPLDLYRGVPMPDTLMDLDAWRRGVDDALTAQEVHRD